MIAGRPPDPVLHACLRDLDSWPDVELEGLEVLSDGRIVLERVPGVSPAVDHEPAETEPSGLALDHRCGLYLSDAESGRVIRESLDCPERVVLCASGVIGAPAGLCVGSEGWVFVCDRVRGALVVLTAELRVRDVWTQGLVEPIAVASDGLGRLVVAEAEGGLVRFDRHGRRDSGFGASPAASVPASAVALSPDGAVFAATETGIRCFDESGAPVHGLLDGSAIGPLAVCGDMLFAADVMGGIVRPVQLSQRRERAPVAGYRGPLAALACGHDGRLYLKPGAGESYLVAEPEAASAASGQLLAGPLDAGEQNVWRRVAAEVEHTSGVEVVLETAGGDVPDPPLEWVRAAAPDTLLEPGRFLWVRVTLAPDELSGESPAVLQVHARTPGGSYFEHLPAIYARENPESSVLERFLSLAQAQLDDMEGAIESLPELADPERAPLTALSTLANWQAFDLPPSATGPAGAPEARRLIGELPELRSGRGTPGGVAEFVELYAGVRPAIFECFHDRRLWILGETSTLGFDTSLLGAAVDGLLLGETMVGEGGPENADAWGEALFSGSAHLFTVVVPEQHHNVEGAVRAVLATEKPAHTSFHLCVAGPQMRVGVQATVGLDALVSDERVSPAPGEGAALDFDARTTPVPLGSAGSVGERDRLGLETLIG